jgi:transcriptional regulator with XRE-family HTH domain
MARIFGHRAPVPVSVQGMDLRTRRTDLGKTLAQVADEAGIDEAAPSEIERGIRQPKLHTLRRIVRALDMEDLEYTLAGLVPRSRNGSGK